MKNPNDYFSKQNKQFCPGTSQRETLTNHEHIASQHYEDYQNKKNVNPCEKSRPELVRLADATECQITHWN